MYGEIFDADNYKIFKDSKGPPGDNFFEVPVSEYPKTEVIGTEEETKSEGDNDDPK